MTVSDSLIDNCGAETRIDHQVDDDDKRVSPNSFRTIDDLDSSSSSDGGSSESSQSNDKSSLSRPLMIVAAILKSRHPGGPITTEIHPLDMATMGRDNSLGTIVATMDSSVIALPIKIVQIIQTTGIRIKIETSLVIILITKIDHTITTVCLIPTSTSKMIRDIIPGEIRTMRDSTRIPHIVPKTMIRM